MKVEKNSELAWEPFTPRGVAAFAHARFGCLLAAQCIIALIAAASVIWFLQDSVFPIVYTAIKKLPETGFVRSARLDWHGDSPVMLAEGRALALDVDLNHGGGLDSTADLQIEFGRETIWASGLFGYVEFPYPAGVSLPFNRAELEPRWGAWKAEIFIAAGVLTVVGLLAGWWLLAAVYSLPIWLLGFFVNRDLNLRQSWKLSGAALLPGALLVAASIVLYNFSAVDLIQLGLLFGAHFVLGWTYLFVSLLFVPAIPAVLPGGNPFAPPRDP